MKTLAKQIQKQIQLVVDTTYSDVQTTLTQYGIAVERDGVVQEVFAETGTQFMIEHNDGGYSCGDINGDFTYGDASECLYRMLDDSMVDALCDEY